MALPEDEQLLQLLQRAADELKASQQETAEARAQVVELTEKLQLSEQALALARASRLEASDGPTTLPPGVIPVALLKTQPGRASVTQDEKTSVGDEAPGLLAQRVKGLQDEIATLEAERRELKERVRSLETKPAESTDTSRKPDTVAADPAVWEAKAKALESELGQLNQSLQAEQKRFTDEHQRLNETTLRISQLESDLVGLKARRDGLHLEIGKVENERNAARARVTELEATLSQTDAALAAEKERVATLEPRVRELEAQQVRAKGAFDDLKQAMATDAVKRQAEVEQERAEQLEVVRALEARVAELSTEAERATSEWRHVDRQYEQLHREMLTILDQRDEARRELGDLKARFGLS